MKWRFFLFVSLLVLSIIGLVFSFTIKPETVPQPRDIVINGTTYYATPIIPFQNWLILMITWAGCFGILVFSILSLEAWFEE